MSSPESWHTAAACNNGVDPDLFYKGDRHPEDTNRARSICHGCPVRIQCLTAAYTSNEAWGIWGGLTRRERSQALRAASGIIPRAVATITGDTTTLLRHIYNQHTRPDGHGHTLWTDNRTVIKVQGRNVTVHRLALAAITGRAPVGHVVRTCDRERCVAHLADDHIRAEAKAAA